VSVGAGDDAWRALPTFGAREAGVVYTVRPSAYALVADGAGRLAVVRTPLGVFLPGGGMDPGETPAATVVREVEEECGLVVRVGGWAAAAVHLVWSPQERTHFEKRSTFLDAVVERPGAPAVELDHELAWLAPAEAAAAMAHESHAWAVARWTAGAGR
jgi:8-oxo-dGTP diphosphatase